MLLVLLLLQTASTIHIVVVPQWVEHRTCRTTCVALGRLVMYAWDWTHFSRV